MEVELQKGELKCQVECLKLSVGAQVCLFLTLASASRHEVHSSQPAIENLL